MSASPEFPEPHPNLVESWEAFLERCDPDEFPPLQWVLNAHLITENGIEQILSLLLPKSDELSRFSYSQKVNVLAAFKLIDPSRIAGLRSFNSLRNNFAHKLDFEPTMADVEKVGAHFPKIWKKVNDKAVTECPMGRLFPIIGLICGDLCRIRLEILECQEGEQDSARQSTTQV